MGFGQLEWLRRKISDLLNQQRVDQKADMIETNTATQNVITNTIYTDNDVTRDEIRNFNWADNDVTRDEILNNLRPLLGGGHLPTVTGIIVYAYQDIAGNEITLNGKGLIYMTPRSHAPMHTVIIDDISVRVDWYSYNDAMPFWFGAFSRYVTMKGYSPSSSYPNNKDVIIFFTT